MLSEARIETKILEKLATLKINVHSLIAHWKSYLSDEPSPITEALSPVDPEVKFESILGHAFCSPCNSLTDFAPIYQLRTTLIDSTKSLLQERSALLLNWNVLEEILCIRYISSDWVPIQQEQSQLSVKLQEAQIEHYAESRKFLLKLFEELIAVFEVHIESHPIQLEEAIWFRDFWIRAYSCLIVEVYQPYRVILENELYAKRPTNFNSTVLQFRFIRGGHQASHAVQQKSPWIDRTLMTLIERSWPVFYSTHGEINAALHTLGESEIDNLDFRFYFDPSDRYVQTNRQVQDIDIRYFGKSLERLFDKIIVCVTDYLINNCSCHEDIISRRKIYLINKLINTYLSAAQNLPEDIATDALYFPPAEPESFSEVISSPAASMQPLGSKINPSRDVREVYEIVEAIL